MSHYAEPIANRIIQGLMSAPGTTNGLYTAIPFPPPRPPADGDGEDSVGPQGPSGVRGPEGPPGRAAGIYVRDFIVDLASPQSITQGFISAIAEMVEAGESTLIVSPGVYPILTGRISLVPGMKLIVQEGATISTSQTGNMFNGLGCHYVRVENAGEFVAPSTQTLAFAFDQADYVWIDSPRMTRCTIARFSDGSFCTVNKPVASAPVEGLPMFGPACIDIFFTNDWQVLNPQIEGYAHGVQFWGGDAQSNQLDSDGSRISTPLGVPRQCRNGLVQGGRVWGSSGGGVWGSMGDNITVDTVVSEFHQHVNIDFEGTINSTIVNCRSRDAVNGGIAFFYCCDNNVVKDTKTIVSSSAFKPLGIWGVASTKSDSVRFENVHFECESGFCETGYDFAGFDDLQLIGCSAINVALRFHNVAGHRQEIRDLISINNTEFGYTALTCGNVLSKGGHRGIVIHEENTYINQWAINGDGINGTAVIVFHNGANALAPELIDNGNTTKGFSVDVLIKPSGTTNTLLAPEVEQQDNTWGNNNVVFEAPLSGQQPVRVRHRQNNRQRPGVLIGPGVVARSPTYIDGRGGKPGDTIIIGEDGAFVPDSAESSAGRTVINDYKPVPDDLEGERWLYVCSLMGKDVADASQSVGVSIRATPGNRSSNSYQHDLLFGSRFGFFCNHKLFGLTSLAEQETSVEVYKIAGDTEQDAYRVYIRVQPGLNSVRVKMDELSHPLQYDPFLSERLTTPTGEKIFDSNLTQPQLWVPSNRLIGGGESNDPATAFVSVRGFGAKGIGLGHDDTEAFRAAFKSNRNVVIPPTTGFYNITDVSVISGVSNLTIQATGARILCSDKTKQSWLYEQSQNISIEGGDWGYSQAVTENGGGAQHVFQFNECQKVLCERVEVSNSPEIGMAITGCNHVTIKHGNIHNTFRDGIYCRYSANVRFLYNTLDNIKDDAISFHDKDNTNVAVDVQKQVLAGYGYSQASNATIEGNIITKAFQGVGSIGAKNLTISKNKIYDTVIAGIAVFNILNTAPEGVDVCSIDDNTLIRTNTGATINGTLYPNIGQAGTGRAAIFVGSLGEGNQLGGGATKRLKDISIHKNRVIDCGAHGLLVNKTDGLLLTENTFKNCAGANAVTTLTGNVIELGDITDYFEANNKFIDTRSTPLHNHIVEANDVTGLVGDCYVRGRLSSERQYSNARPITVQQRDNVISASPVNIDAAGPVSFDTYQTAGVFQVAGTGWATTTNRPPGATAGTLVVARSNDTVVQTYTDLLGSQAYRHLNGTLSGNWSEWKVIATGNSVPSSQPNIDSAGSVDWNTYLVAGSYQVAGTGWGTAPNSPRFAGGGMATAGTLEVARSNDTVVQTYTDYLGNQAFRHLNGFLNQDLSGWKSYERKVTGDEKQTLAEAQALTVPAGRFALVYVIEEDTLYLKTATQFKPFTLFDPAP